MVFRVPRVLTQSDVRQLFGNLSRPNYYQVQFGGLSAGLRSHLASKGVNSRFSAEDMGLLCYSARLPGSSLASVESNNYHGVVENFAHTRIYTPITLSFYTDDQYRALRFLEHWMEYAAGGNGINNSGYSSKFYSARMNYPDDPADGYKSESTKIFKFEPNVERVMEYSFIGLFPKNLSSTQVSYGPQNQVTRVTCSFSYDRHIAGSIYSFDQVRGNGFGTQAFLDTADTVRNAVNEIIDAPSRFLSNLIN